MLDNKKQKREKNSSLLTVTGSAATAMAQTAAEGEATCNDQRDDDQRKQYDKDERQPEKHFLGVPFLPSPSRVSRRRRRSAVDVDSSSRHKRPRGSGEQFLCGIIVADCRSFHE